MVGINGKKQVFYSEVDKDFKQFFDLKHLYGSLSEKEIKGKVFSIGDFELRVGILSLG